MRGKLKLEKEKLQQGERKILAEIWKKVCNHNEKNKWETSQC